MNQNLSKFFFNYELINRFRNASQVINIVMTIDKYIPTIYE